MNIQGVLSIAAIILGCYILLSYFLDEKQASDNTPKPFKPR